MAKRGKSGNGTKAGSTPRAAAGTASAPDPMEQRVVAFAEQLGRIVGTVQAKTEGWMDRDTLSRQITSVRDGAADLLDQLTTRVTNVTGTAGTTGNTTSMNEPKSGTGARTPAPPKAKSGGAARTSSGAGAAGTAKAKGRSGGVVDAPGKKHRKPMPRDPRAMAADSKPARMRSGQTNMTVRKLRAGRG